MRMSFDIYCWTSMEIYGVGGTVYPFVGLFDLRGLWEF